VKRRVQVCWAAGGMSPMRCVFAVTKSAESAAHENVPSAVSKGLKGSRWGTNVVRGIRIGFEERRVRFRRSRGLVLWGVFLQCMLAHVNS
jgi:hypothetical protein